MRRSLTCPLLILIGAGGLAVRESLAQLPASVAGAAAAPATNAALQAELAKGLAWPAVAIVIAIVFRRPLTLFMSALGSRITRLSLFKVELEMVPASPALDASWLDEIRAAEPAVTADGKSLLLELVQSGTRADYVLVALGAGTEWITSRLYIALVMTERMRGVKACVFVEHGVNTERNFVAVASVSEVRWALARRYPWLEAAWLQGQLSLYKSAQAPPDATWRVRPCLISRAESPVMTDNGGFTPDHARTLAENFLQSLQRPPTQELPAELGWITMKHIQERAEPVTRKLLAALLPVSAFDAWAPSMRDAPRARLTRAVLRCPGPFIALLDNGREFSRLTNRQALLDEIAAKLGEEPDEAAR